MGQNLPAKIGKYEVLEVLGQGGMGTVYKGVDPLIGRLVAIKVIVADYIDNPELLKRFYREAEGGWQSPTPQHRHGLRPGRGEQESLPSHAVP